MNKRLVSSLTTTIAMSIATLLIISCSSKQPKPEPPAGGDESGSMSPQITDTPMSGVGAGSDSGAIAGLHSINFELDSSTLSQTSRKQLAENADWIKKNGAVTVQVEGHCDNRGSVEYNLALGERRAKAVKNYLVSLGIPTKRLTIISYGEERPLVPGDSEEAYAKNRRANFVPLGK
jgi:peptidoglycan-associated lipoprotein